MRIPPGPMISGTRSYRSQSRMRFRPSDPAFADQLDHTGLSVMMYERSNDIDRPLMYEIPNQR